MDISQVIEAGASHVFTKQVTLNYRGVTGQTVLLNIQRLSDDLWWNGTTWGSAETDLTCVETGSAYAGEYTYYISGSEIQDGVTYMEQFKILTGPYAFNSVRRVSALYNVDKLSLAYDFATYSNAVILWYAVDRPFGVAIPIYWAYVYNAVGGKPTDSSDICLRDRVIRWSESQPSA